MGNEKESKGKQKEEDTVRVRIAGRRFFSTRRRRDGMGIA
jgi:hypothetical protein